MISEYEDINDGLQETIDGFLNYCEDKKHVDEPDLKDKYYNED